MGLKNSYEDLMSVVQNPSKNTSLPRERSKILNNNQLSLNTSQKPIRLKKKKSIIFRRDLYEAFN